MSKWIAARCFSTPTCVQPPRADFKTTEVASFFNERYVVGMTLAQHPTVAARVAEAQAHWNARRESLEVEQMFLPGLHSELRAMPNPVARSSIFAPVARGRKIYHDQTVLVSRSDATITYTGHQLDEGQADAWMQLIYEAKDAPLGQSVVICCRRPKTEPLLEVVPIQN